MKKSQLKQAIDPWRSLYLKQREALIPRDGPSLPDKKLALALLGVRRCGKTSLAINISREIDAEKVFYFNFEDPLFFNASDPTHLADLLLVAQEFSTQPFELLILDEIQNVKGWERWVRTLVDQQNYRIIITGSSAQLLTSEIATSLTGRCLVHYTWPLSYSEFLSFKGNLDAPKENELSLLREYLEWGGFPEIVLRSDSFERTRILKQYLSDILLKDVIQRHEIRSPRLLEQIATYYLTNFSSLHSYSAVAKAFSSNTELVGRYSDALENAFLCFEVDRYHKNLKVQARDPRKIYAVDNGLRAIASRSPELDTGKLLENCVYLELRRRELKIMYFQNDGEVDFLVLDGYQPQTPIQVCETLSESEKTRNRELKSVEQCLKRFSLKEGMIITFNEEENLHLDDGRMVKVVPAWKWLRSS